MEIELKFQRYTNGSPLVIQIKFNWISSWKFNEIQMEIYLESSLNSVAISVENQWDQLKIQLKFQWYTNGNFNNIHLKFQWNSNGNPLEIELQFQWNAKGNPLEMQLKFTYKFNLKLEIGNWKLNRNSKDFLISISKTMKYQWKSSCHSHEIHWKSSLNPIPFSMEYQWDQL